MFELGGKLYEYEGRIREIEEEKQREIEELNNSLNVKYDEDYQEMNQKIELIEKEKEYFKEKFNEKEQELAKKTEEIRHR
jgi:chromosome segregation ATPase